MSLNRIVDDLEDYYKTISLFENLYTNLKVSLSADIMLNYRDALCHYVKCYDAFDKNEKEFIRQEANLYEHLNRGLKDGLLSLIYLYCTIITYMMDENKLKYEQINKIRAFLHKFKNLSLDIRFKGISITRMLDNDNNDNNDNNDLLELLQFISDFDELIVHNTLLKKYYEKAIPLLKKH